MKNCCGGRNYGHVHDRKYGQLTVVYLEGLLVALKASVAGYELASDLLEEYFQRWERRVLHLPVFVRAEGNQSVMEGDRVVPVSIRCILAV